MEKLSSTRHGRREARFVESAPRWLPLVLAALGLGALYLAGGDAFAEGVCSDTPGTGNHIECVEESSSTDDIDIDAMGIDIDFTATGITSTGGGVHAWHKGNENVDINIAGATTGTTTTPSTIDTTGRNGHGISGKLFGEGALTITLQDTAISTHGATAYGLRADHQGTGDLTVNLGTGTTINTHGSGGPVPIL